MRTALPNDGRWEGEVSLPEPSESFAEKTKTNIAMQVAVFTEPAYIFSEADKLDFLDVMGDMLHDVPSDMAMPTFVSTIRRDKYILVTSANEYSKNWLFNAIPKLGLWNGFKTLAIPAKEIPKLVKGLLWLPGKKKLSNEIILDRISKQNPLLKTSSWRIYSRHEEEHGTRLSVGVDECNAKHLSEIDNKPQWSTSRGVFTPIEALIAKKKTLKSQKQFKTNILEPSGVNDEVITKNFNQQVSGLVKHNDLKRKSKADSVSPELPREQVVNEAVRTGTEEKEQGFTPSRALARSPVSQRSASRPENKRKKMEGDYPGKGKITEFLNRTRSHSLPKIHFSPTDINNEQTQEAKRIDSAANTRTQNNNSKDDAVCTN